MSEYDETITLNSITLRVNRISPIRKQLKRKTVIGKTLIQTEIIGLNDYQLELEISGIVYEDVATTRTSLEALDYVTQYTYTDGIHDGTYYLVKDSLAIDDDANNGGTHFKYKLRLVQV